MKQKLALCCALVSQPEVLLLDEPTTGVDPVSRREFWDVLAELSAQGMTIVVATPYLDEAERCHRVGLMYNGEIHEIGTSQELRNNLGLHRLEVRTQKLEITEEILSQNQEKNLVDVQIFGDRLDVLVKDITIGENQVNQLLKPYYPHIEHGEPTLENVFVTRLRQQGLIPQFFPFPRFRKRGKSETKEIAIYAHKLNKIFGKFPAVKDVNVEVKYGEIFGLLGANGAGKTTTIKMLILVTTHYLEEAEQCNRMCFMVAGEIAAEGSPSFIKASQPGQLIEIIVNKNQAASKLLKQKFASWRVSIFANSLHIVIDHPEKEISEIRQLLETNDITIYSLRNIPFSLEDAFIGIVQRTIDN